MVKTLEAIESRLEELEEEKGELKEFQEKDRDRKSLEYAIFSKELEEISLTLESVSCFPVPVCQVGRREKEGEGTNSRRLVLSNRWNKNELRT